MVLGSTSRRSYTWTARITHHLVCISVFKGMNSYIFISGTQSAFSIDLGLDKP